MCEQKIHGIPLCSCGCRAAYLIWWAIPVFVLYTGIFYSAEPESVQSLEKQFGLGVGPSFVKYQHLEAGLLRRQAYEAYFGYRKWSKQISEAELVGYKRLYADNSCSGGCEDSSHSRCVRGQCQCQAGHSKHRYGKCWETSKIFSQFDKLRQSPVRTETPVLLPPHCYLDLSKRVLDQLQQHKPECFQETTVTTGTTVSAVAWASVQCGQGETCHHYDINMQCQGGRCQCRQDMRWSDDTLQCELYLQTDCSQVTKEKVDNHLKETLLSKTPYPAPSLQEDDIRSVYCNVLEGIWQKHIENIRGWKHPKHLDYFTTGGLVALIIAIVFFSLDLLMLYNYLKIYIRSYDPVFQLQTLSRAEKFLMLGGLAASEAQELQEEQRDESRAAMMQSNF